MTKPTTPQKKPVANAAAGAAKKPATNTKPAAAKTPSVDAMPHSLVDRAVATGWIRDIYQRDRHFFVMRITMILAGLLCLSMLSNFYLWSRDKEFVYIGIDGRGGFVELNALDRPIHTPESVASWTSKVVLETFALDQLNYRQTLNRVRGNFRPGSWLEFEKAIGSAVVEKMLEIKGIVKPVIRDAVIVVSQGPNLFNDGRFGYVVEVPVSLRYEGKTVLNANQILVVSVVREEPINNIAGLSILSIKSRVQ